MAIIVSCSRPDQLLESIKKEISAGRIKTWECESGGDFTYIPDQWQSKAFLRPYVTSEKLHFAFLFTSANVPTDNSVYGVYIGRFIEMLLTHFGADFSEISAIPTHFPLEAT